MTPEMQYIGRTALGQAWDCKNFTVMMTEYVPINRASNKAEWKSGMDVAFEVTEKLAGPTAECGFGKFCPVKIEQGEDNGLLVVKATFDCSIVSKYDEPRQKVATPVLTPASTQFEIYLNIYASCDTEGAAIRYTLDGSEPTEDSQLLPSGVAIRLDNTKTVKAKAFKDGFDASDVVTEYYEQHFITPEWGEGEWTIDTVGTAEYFPDDDEYYFSTIHGEKYFTIPKNGQIELYINGRNEGFWDSTDFDRTQISQRVTFINRDSGQTRSLGVSWEE